MFSAVKRVKENNMRKEVKRFLMIATVIITALTLHFAYSVLRQVKRATTYGTLSAIYHNLGKALGAKPFVEYDLAAEILERRPDIPLKNGRIVDAWETPIIVKIERASNVVLVTSISAGPDKKMGTRDDLVKKIAWDDEQDLLETIEEGVVWDGPLIVKPHE